MIEFFTIFIASLAGVLIGASFWNVILKNMLPSWLTRDYKNKNKKK